jgi:hypothetical protein
MIFIFSTTFIHRYFPCGKTQAVCCTETKKSQKMADKQEKSAEDAITNAIEQQCRYYPSGVALNGV